MYKKAQVDYPSFSDSRKIDTMLATTRMRFTPAECGTEGECDTKPSRWQESRDRRREIDAFRQDESWFVAGVATEEPRQNLSPAELARALGGDGTSEGRARFTPEGGMRN